MFYSLDSIMKENLIKGKLPDFSFNNGADHDPETCLTLFPYMRTIDLKCMVVPDQTQCYAALYYQRYYSDQPARLVCKGRHVRDETEALNDLLARMQRELNNASRRAATESLGEIDDESWKGAVMPIRSGSEVGKKLQVSKELEAGEGLQARRETQTPPPYSSVVDSGLMSYVPRVLMQYVSRGETNMSGAETDAEEKESLLTLVE